MATKDSRIGLLSKVALFVRNPTKDWSELERPSQSEDANYDKQVLKAMIERKRQNDFIRRREFDHLRKLRNRDPVGAAAMARQSFFQNSVSSDLEVRADTLKKIDEIEAQMSRQWWKNKAAAGDAEGETSPETAPISDLPSEVKSDLVQTDAFSATEVTTGRAQGAASPAGAADAAPVNMPELLAPSEFITTQLSAPGVPRAQDDLDVMARLQQVREAADRLGAEAKLMQGGVFAIDVEDETTDPELEEAAIRFANGDADGAESALRAALAGGGVQAPESLRAWALALLDLYRVAGRHADFEHAAQEFAGCLQDVQPVWVDLSVFPTTRAGLLPSTPASLQPTPPGAPLWRCPRVLDAASMLQLQESMGTSPMPWYLDWSGLERAQEDALPLLLALMGSLCDEAAQVRFAGADNLLNVVRERCPSGDRSVAQDWWLLRLNLLRILCLQDDFELTALDYCVTFEVSPPAWQPARSTIAPGETPDMIPEPEFSTATAPMDYAVSEGPCVLTGELLGDVSDVLRALEAYAGNDQLLNVGCGGLLRVDFAAAGSILNWVARWQSAGGQVRFQNVHRLLLAFFNVIGINEHATITPRAV